MSAEPTFRLTYAYVGSCNNATQWKCHTFFVDDIQLPAWRVIWGQRLAEISWGVRSLKPIWRCCNTQQNSRDWQLKVSWVRFPGTSVFIDSGAHPRGPPHVLEEYKHAHFNILARRPEPWQKVIPGSSPPKVWRCWQVSIIQPRGGFLDFDIASRKQYLKCGVCVLLTGQGHKIMEIQGNSRYFILVLK
jgi:hypothetical protein